MKSIHRLSVLGCGALLALASLPLLADDAVLISAPSAIRIGTVALEPGSYLLRAPSSIPTRNVVVVSSPDETKVYGYVLAIHESGWRMSSPVDRMVVDDSGALRTWVVGWKDAAYSFTATPVPPALMSRAARAVKTTEPPLMVSAVR